MKEQELLLLGLIQEEPKHGYQLKKQLRQIADTFIGLKTDSIYYPLKQMLKAGLVTQSRDKEGRRPAKYTYTITLKGKEEFQRLLLKNILTIEKPYFSIDLSLYFLNYIPLDLRRRCLKARLKLLTRLKNSLQRLRLNLKPPAPDNHTVILEHNLELLDAELKFIEKAAR